MTWHSGEMLKDAGQQQDDGEVWQRMMKGDEG